MYYDMAIYRYIVASLLCSINIEIPKCFIVLSGAHLTYVVNITFCVLKVGGKHPTYICQKSNRLLILGVIIY